MIHTKEINTSSNGRCGAKGSSVRIKLTNRINGRTLHFCAGQLIPQLRRSASTIHLQTIFDTPFEHGNHCTNMMGHDFNVGKVLKNSRECQTHHGNRGLIGPANCEPQLIFRTFFRRKLRNHLTTHRVNKDRQIVLFTGFINRPIFFCVNGFPIHMSVNLNALCTHIFDTLDFFNRCLHVIERDSSDEAFVEFRVSLDDFFDFIIADCCQPGGLVRSSKSFNRRRHDVGNLLVTGEFFQHLIPTFHVGHGRDFQCTDKHMRFVGSFCHTDLRIFRRHQMAKYVNRLHSAFLS